MLTCVIYENKNTAELIVYISVFMKTSYMASAPIALASSTSNANLL